MRGKRPRKWGEGGGRVQGAEPGAGVEGTGVGTGSIWRTRKGGEQGAWVQLLDKDAGAIAVNTISKP